jgi:alkylation response protein AidB-like acyl-CoA dehydrogenase
MSLACTRQSRPAPDAEERLLSSARSLAQEIAGEQADGRPGRDAAGWIAVLRGHGLPGACARADQATVLRVVESVSWADGSAGWLLAAAQVGRLLPGDREPDVFVTGSPVVGGSVRPLPSPGAGYELTGRWPAVPGAAVADRCVVTAELLHPDREPVGSGPRPVLRTVVLPTGDPGLGRPAETGGLRGAGELPVVADALVVTPDRILDPFAAAPTGDRLPPPTAHLLVAVAVALGVARRALEEFVAAARHRSRLGAVTRMAEQPRLQVGLNREAMSYRAARELLLHELASLPTGRGVVSTADRVRLAAAGLHAQQAAQRAVRYAFAKAGASALYVGHPLERCWQDSEAIARQAVFGAETEHHVAAAQFGRYVPAHVL